MTQSTAIRPTESSPVAHTVAAPSVTFALCVEAGGFESMAVRAITSLRKFGGRFANCPVTAVTPRFGPSLTRATRDAFDDLETTYSNAHPANRYSWYPYVNKVLAALEAQRTCSTDHVCYIDADMLVIDEPDLLDLDDETDLAACAADKNIGSGDADETTPYWREISRTLGLNYDDLPWVHAHRDNADIRIYFNAGLFCYRKSCAFAEQYLNCVNTLLDAKVSSKVSDIYFLEQASLGLAAVKSKARWKALPHVYNYAMGRKIMDQYEPAKVRQGKILHYHDMMWPEMWPALLEKLQADRPEVHDWLATLGPLREPGSKLQQVFSKVLHAQRKRKSGRHIAACKVV
jgi:lipopolysaccharide biosynthesis glycosyltransferase